MGEGPDEAPADGRKPRHGDGLRVPQQSVASLGPDSHANRQTAVIGPEWCVSLLAPPPVGGWVGCLPPDPSAFVCSHVRLTGEFCSNKGSLGQKERFLNH